MTKNIQWIDGKEHYILRDGFALKRADKVEFGIHETIYSGVDIELIFSWKRQIDIDYDDLFWIMKDGKRIGGVHIRPNLMGSFFMSPPYLVDRFRAIKEINRALTGWSDREKGIKIYGVTPKDIENFYKLGYRIKCERRVMIRPTEIFEDIQWGNDLRVKTPTMDDIEAIGNLFYECYKGGIDYEMFGEQTPEEAIKNAGEILELYKANNVLDGSVLVYDKNTDELVGGCIAGIHGFCDNGFSEIGEIVVKPSYRGKGIAANLIRSSLTGLKSISQATILCVTIGNHAEGLYHDMGFFSGVKFANMYLK